MQENQHIDEKLLIQFLLGEISEQEMLRVDEWLRQSEENQKQLDTLEQIWLESGKLTPQPVAVDVKKAWEAMSLRVDEHQATHQIQKGKIISLKLKIIRVAYGAAAVVAITFGIFKFVIEPKLPIDQLSFSSNQKIFKGTLPDGSEIALNLNSKLIYPEKFNKNSRQVELEGEAFFEVAHNAQQPFIINAGEAKIKVLGTSFSVKAEKNSNVEVSVSTGRVLLFRVDSISGDTASILLTSGQKGVLSKSGIQPHKLDEPIEPDEMFWMDRTLVFKQIELSKVLLMLEKYYKVTIKMENEMALNCSYTATFTNADIEDILNMMATTFNFELIKNGSNYVIKGNGCLDN